MIRYAQPEETQQVIALFHRCFPGEQDFSQWFFAQIYKSEKTIVYVEGDLIVSAIQMLDVTLRDKSGDKKACYIYGVGTLPEYRGKGIANQLLEFSFEENRKNQLDFSILITQNDGLFDFYKRFGYTEYFYVHKSTVTKADFGLKITPITQEILPQIDAIYEDTMAGKLHNVRTLSHYEKQLDLFQISCVTFDEKGAVKAYAFGYIEEETMVLTECMGCDIAHFSAQLAHCYNAKTCTYLTGEATGEKIRLGMIKPILSQSTGQGYLNLLYN